jgi:2-polyprenyl-6-methoxyphenol hydroxylase-like FAD-dependent oxidoreductase
VPTSEPTEPTEPIERGTTRRAVVLGAGLGGLVAARVLNEHFDEVTIVERDVVPGSGRGRRGVPQGRHVHGMQAGGLPVLEAMFPGLRDELVEDGVREVDDLARVSLRLGGRLLSREPYAVAPVLPVTRPHLEWRVRERVRHLPGVRVAEGLEVIGLTSSADSAGRRVTGVRVAPAAVPDAHERTIDAELVVDATGRGSRMPVWLEQLGYDRPEEERVVVHVGYASQTMRLPEGVYPRDMVIEGRVPGRSTGFAAFRCERDRWTVSLMSYGRGVRPPVDPDERMQLVEQRAPGWLAAAVRAAEPVDEVATHTHPASVWRHYERLSAHPAGVIAFGDAMAAFNPIYGTGMTVAAKQAVALQSALAGGLDDLPRRFYGTAVRPLREAWQLSTGADLAFPETEGRRTRVGMLMGRYVARVLAAAERDPEVTRRFLRVAGLLDSPGALFAPGMVARVLRARPQEMTVAHPLDWSLQAPGAVGSTRPTAAAHGSGARR